MDFNIQSKYKVEICKGSLELIIVITVLHDKDL